MTEQVDLAEYLFTRLRQLGVDSIHGVPGDYNLQALDYIEPAGIHWVRPLIHRSYLSNQKAGWKRK